MTTTTNLRLLARREVEELTGLSCSTLYKQMRSGDFPLPLKIGRSVRWRADEITTWLDGLPRATGDRPEA